MLLRIRPILIIFVAFACTAIYNQIQYVSHEADKLKAIHIVWLDWWWVTVTSIIIFIIFIWTEYKAYRIEQKKDVKFQALVNTINKKLDRLIKENKKSDIKTS